MSFLDTIPLFYNWIEAKHGFVKVNFIRYLNEKFEDTIPFSPTFMGAC
jgi:hypothetical protein